MALSRTGELMNLSVQVEKPSKIVRKLTIKVPAQDVAQRFERGLAQVARTARLKGFRPGHAPMSVVKQFYGAEVRHNLYHSLIDESFAEAVKQEKLMTVGRPAIESPDHTHGHGEHDHSVSEDKDFTFTATVEVMPEIEVKGYTGIALTKEKAEVADKDLDTVIDGLRGNQAELIPVEAGARKAKMTDHVEITFKGGMVTDGGLDEKPGMSGTRMVEIGSNSLIPGFEEELVGMKTGETKTFKIKFPADYFEAEFQGKEAQFTVTMNEMKEKKMPELNDEFAKQMGYESVADLRTKAKEHLTQQRTLEVDRKLRSDLIDAIVKKNEFDVPAALIESQTRALAQDWAQDLKRQGIDDKTIQMVVMQEIENLKKRAESQVRASLVLESIAKQEKIALTEADFSTEVEKAAAQMGASKDQLLEFYAKNPGRKEDFEFRLRQEATLKFLLDKAKIKS